MAKHHFGSSTSGELPRLLRPVPGGGSILFLCTIVGAFLGPRLLGPGASPQEAGEVCGLPVLASFFNGGMAGFLLGTMWCLVRAISQAGATSASRRDDGPGIREDGE